MLNIKYNFTSQELKNIQFHIRKYGSYEYVLKYLLLNDLDCTKILDNIGRPNQTINYGYKIAISEYNYILDLLLKETNDNNLYEEYKNKLKLIHNNNIEYEKLNPPIIYEYKKTKVKTKVKTKTEKSNKIPKTTKPKLTKEEKANIKMKKLAESITFKIPKNE